MDPAITERMDASQVDHAAYLKQRTVRTSWPRTESWSSQGLDFEVLNLYDLPERDLAYTRVRGARR
jgi:hypothetical protein